MGKTLRRFAQAVVILLVTAGLLEISLRLFPRLVPPSLLVDFNPAAREKIARRLELPTDRSVIFPPRDDGGPPRRFRIFRPHASVAWEIPDDGFVDRVVMDRNGFCNPPAAASEQDRVEFLALGDSFTFCTGVLPEQAWPARLAALAGAPGWNLGAPGIGIYEHLQILDRYGLKKSPRFVILNLYEGNDLRDAASYAAYREAVGQGGQAPARKFLKDRPLGQSSFAYNLIVVGARHLSHALRGLLSRAAGLPSGEAPPPDFRYRLRLPGGSVAFNGGNVDTDEVRSARELRSGAISLESFRQGLETFVALSRRHGFEPIVAYTPSAHTAYADYVEFHDPTLKELMPWFSRTQREFFREKGAELGYRFLDLTPALQEAARTPGERELLYFPSILHLTSRGHGVVAGALAANLRSPTPDDRMPAGVSSPPPQPRRMGQP